MNRIVVVLMVALALCPLPVAGQQNAAARIETAKRDAAAAGIPVALLESRVAEGRAKGVPMERIAAAVERRASSLIQARQALTPAVRNLTEADLSAGADAVEAGIEGGALREVIASAQAEDRPVALAVLTYLHREQGMPVGEAVGHVKQALKSGPEALRTLPSQAAANRGGGRGRTPPGQAKKGTSGAPQAIPTPGKKPGVGKPTEKPGKGKGRGGE